MIKDLDVRRGTREELYKEEGNTMAKVDIGLICFKDRETNCKSRNGTALGSYKNKETESLLRA